MRRVTRGDTANRDLDEILSYLVEQSEAAAERLVAQLEAACRPLATSPLMGRSRDDLAPGLRSIVVGRYLVFFTSIDEDVFIVRILHGSRNITPELCGEE